VSSDAVFDPGSTRRSWSVQLFGPLAIRTGQVSVELGPPKQRALLAILVLHANEVVSVDRLIELLWGEAPPRTAAHSVQIYMSALRKLLATLQPPPTIVTRPPGYRLDIDPKAIDIARFEVLVSRGGEALGVGRQESGIDLLEEAVGLWHGPALAEFAYDEFAQPHIARLEELRLDAGEQLAAAELSAGRVQAALQRAEQLSREAPLREQGQELVMLALYRSGRHVEAIRSYERHRRMLAEELGVVPAPALQRLNERILLHDPLLLPEQEPPAHIGIRTRNPYKGLRPFREEDAADFFGRDELVEGLLGRLRAGQRLVALVGPSGSGKSSVVAAGLLPALRSGAVDGSNQWLIASMVPGPQPLREVQALLTRTASSPTGPRPLDADGSVRPSPSIRLTAEQGHVVLVVDQFEELFLAADELERRQFLDALGAAVTDRDGELSVILTLRADHYDRPLLYPDFAELFTASVLHVLPMSANGLESAVVRPASQVGVHVQPALLARLIADTADQPGSLPLLQYALTTQFDQSTGATLTLDDYRALGGLRAILSRRADDLYQALSDEQQRVTMQILLRMVRLGHGTADVLRRVSMSELTDLDLDLVALSAVLDQFGRDRLLSFDRDAITGAPTVELAHEALLTEWSRLGAWIDRHRTALGRLESFRAAFEEWESSGRDSDYLLSGRRLTELDAWRHDSVLVLSSRELDFVEAGLAHQRRAVALEAERVSAERRLERRARLRLFALVGAVMLLIGAATLGILARQHAGRPTGVALLYDAPGEVGGLIAAGFDRGVSDFGFAGRKVTSVGSAEGDARLLQTLHDADPALIFVFAVVVDVQAEAMGHPHTRYVTLDKAAAAPNISLIVFDVEDASYLAGAAAALTSTTGTIGFIGGVDNDVIWPFEAGYEAGARAVDANVEILTRYLSTAPNFEAGFQNPEGGAAAARQMFDAGADVVFTAAGSSGLGVFQTAVEMSASEGAHLWTIGTGSDQFTSVVDLPGSLGAAAWQEHILTSVVLHFGDVVYDALAQQADGKFRAGPHHVGLAEGAIDVSYSGGFIDDIRPRIEALRRSILDGTIRVPCRPARIGVTQCA